MKVITFYHYWEERAKKDIYVGKQLKAFQQENIIGILCA